MIETCPKYETFIRIRFLAHVNFQYEAFALTSKEKILGLGLWKDDAVALFQKFTFNSYNFKKIFLFKRLVKDNPFRHFGSGNSIFVKPADISAYFKLPAVNKR